MSRLYDRVLAFGCRAFQPHQLGDETAAVQWRERMSEALEEKRADFASDQDFDEFVAYAVSSQARASHEPRATEKFDGALLDSVPVIAADEVADYCRLTLEPGKSALPDLVTTIAPPFDRFFVEFQGVENASGFNAWGLLFADLSDDLGGADDIGWHLHVTLVIEPRKNDPIGPAAHWIFALDREGLVMTRPEDPSELVSGARLPKMTADPPPELARETTDGLVGSYVLPGLMAISFMHCRNVSSTTVQPDEAPSKRWRKKRGRPLTSYEMLDIAPMREVLESEGRAQEVGLGKALHLCRGHFKTFTEEAPLFGRVTGTFWWAYQVRGSTDHGRVEKSYAVRLDLDLGRPYEPATETPELERHERAGPDPDAAGSGLAAHNRTQNLLAAEVEAAGFTPRRPAPDEPDYDLAWRSDGAIYVAEVKSLTPQNEERQLRMAIGQVVRYRHQLRERGPVYAVVAVEREPSDAAWLDICDEHGLILCWPETFAQAVAPS